MRNTALFIAMSLDGYLADAQGGVSWLQGQDAGEEAPDFYSAFFHTVDTVVMGWNTYHQVVTELSPEQWPYTGLKTWVITHRDLPSTEEIHFTAESPCALVQRLRVETGKAIWICGGAGIVHPLIDEDLIDTYAISIIPTLLGSGIPLFPSSGREHPLKLLRSQSGNGITELTYTRR
ncbi:MAG: dihydrofolate reductase [Lawsonibacter sp.]|nr:dihydrofolate reductase [Lawsonibacter sp.]